MFPAYCIDKQMKFYQQCIYLNHYFQTFVCQYIQLLISVNMNSKSKISPIYQYKYTKAKHFCLLVHKYISAMKKNSKSPVAKNPTINKPSEKEQNKSPADQIKKLSSIKNSNSEANAVKKLLKGEAIYMHFQDENGKTKQMPQYNQVVQQMGGQVYKRMTAKVTIIVTNVNKGQFYKKARELNIPVVDNYWLNHCWNLKQKAPFSQLYVMKEKKPVIEVAKKSTKFQQQSLRIFSIQIGQDLKENANDDARITLIKIFRKFSSKEKNLNKGLHITKPQTYKIPKFQQRVRPGEKRRSLKNRKKKPQADQPKQDDENTNSQLGQDLIFDQRQSKQKTQEDIIHQQFHQKLQKKLAQKQAQQDRLRKQAQRLIQQNRIEEDRRKQQQRRFIQHQQRLKKQQQVKLIKKIQKMQRKQSESQTNSEGSFSSKKSMVSQDKKPAKTFKYQTASKGNSKQNIYTQTKKSSQKLLGFIGSFNFSEKKQYQEEDVQMQVFSFENSKSKIIELQKPKSILGQKRQNYPTKKQQLEDKHSKTETSKDSSKQSDNRSANSEKLSQNQINIMESYKSQKFFNSIEKKRLSNVLQQSFQSEKSVTASISSRKSHKISPRSNKRNKKNQSKTDTKLKKSNSEKSQFSRVNTERSAQKLFDVGKSRQKRLQFIRVHCESYPLKQKILRINVAKQQQNDKTRFQISPLPTEQHLYIFDPVSITDKILAALGPSKAIVSHKFIDYVNTFDTRQLKQKQLNSESFYGRFEQKIKIKEDFVKGKTIFLMDCVNSTILARIILKIGGRLVGGCSEHYQTDQELLNDYKVQQGCTDIIIRPSTDPFDGKNVISEQKFLKKILPD